MTDWPAWLQQTTDVFCMILPFALWFLFCLFAINWNRMWPTLAEGAWVPLVLLIMLVALVWSYIRQTSLTIGGGVTLPNHWWQLLAAAAVAALGLFAGWIQQRYSWTPSEIAVEPAAHGHDDHHGHAHDDGHSHEQPHAKHPVNDPYRKHTASHDHGVDRGGEA